MLHLLEHVLLWFHSLDQQSYLPTFCPWTRKRTQNSWILAQKFHQDMCHHEVPTKHLKESNINATQLYSSIASLCSTQRSEQNLGSRPVNHRDSTQHRQKLFGAGLQFDWTTPMGDKVPDWSGILVWKRVYLTIFGAWCWNQLSKRPANKLWRIDI